MTNITFTEARQKAEDARKQIEEAQKVLAESTKTAVSEGFTALFAKYPFLGSIAWTQYTPYFNDGDPCIFSSSFTYPSINSVKDVEDGTQCTHGDEAGEDFYRYSAKENYLGWNEDRTSRYETNEHFNPEYAACESEIREFCQSLAGNETRRYDDPNPTSFDGALFKAFGDHAQVRVTRDGVEVDYHEHE